MPYIKVDIKSPNGAVLTGCEIPDDYSVQEIIDEVVDVLELPRFAEDNKPIEYSLEFAQGIALSKDQTLRAARVVNGDTLRITSTHKLPNEISHKIVEPVQRLRVFLCHSSGDKQAVRNLYSRLQSDEFEPWLDEQNLLPGHDWHHEITKAVRGSDVVLVCLSQSSINRSGYVQKEIKHALDIADEQPEGTIFLIPLKLEECEVPDRLRRWHWVNLFEDRGYDRLKKSLNSRAAELGLKTYSSSQKLETKDSHEAHLPILLEQSLPNDKKTITVLIRVTTTNQRYSYKVPLDTTVNDLKEFLLKELNIVRRFETGDLIPYKINSKALARCLDDNLTFRENGVPEMDSLTFVAQITGA